MLPFPLLRKEENENGDEESPKVSSNAVGRARRGIRSAMQVERQRRRQGGTREQRGEAERGRGKGG
eukprot:6156622-Pleurochrysis_carterae.AAC.1